MFRRAPRLIWALNQAQRDGRQVAPPAPLGPQRTAIAFSKRAGQPVELGLWGFDPKPNLIGPNGAAYTGARQQIERYATELQPFDRDLPNFEVYLQTLTIPAEAAAGVYVLAPKLETAVLRLSGAGPLGCNASQPVAIEPNQRWRVVVPDDAKTLRLETAESASLVVTDAAGQPATAKTEGGAVRIEGPQPGKAYTIENTGPRRIWFRIADWPAEHVWLTTAPKGGAPTPGRDQTLRRPSRDASHSGERRLCARSFR